MTLNEKEWFSFAGRYNKKLFLGENEVVDGWMDEIVYDDDSLSSTTLTLWKDIPIT